MDFEWQVIEGDVANFSFTSTAAIIGDIGFTYQFNGLFMDSNIKDSLALGVSLQNFGSDLKYELTTDTQNNNEISYQTPRFFKIGFAYGFTAFSDKNLPVFEYVLSGQYGRWLNPEEYYKGDADLGGIGTKVKFWEALELNIGGYYQAYFSFYGNEDVLNIRYGVALNIPFRRWGWDVPITAKFSFTQIPINQGSFYFNDNNKRVSVFTAQISYNVNMF